MAEPADSIRVLAPRWSLAGDEALLSLLQNTHQNIVSKCREVETKLTDLVSSLDNASIDLQNVNNKFMSLSNRQFIESRVYDDDTELTTDEKTHKEPQNTEVFDELNMIKNSLAILDSMHEATEIVDDSDSDSDAEISVVLKQKDMYADRPLPYIIGTNLWKSKWHAGLITETSDTELSSKEQSDAEYSESEEELQTDRHNVNTISESSSLQSDRDVSHIDRVPERPDLDRVQARPQPTPAEIAAKIASAMAKNQPCIERPLTPPSPEHNLPKKPPAVYKPTQHITSTIFPNEPPPLDQSGSDTQDDDIFAEITKNKPYSRSVKVQDIDDLFVDNGSFVPYEGRSYFKDESPPVNKTPPKVGEQSKSVPQSQSDTTDRTPDNTTKKPKGGISLFGTNTQTDTIGAAILKRNQNRPSTSEESDNDTPYKHNTTHNAQNNTSIKQNTDEIDNIKVGNTEKDIFDNLFAKAATKSKEKDQKTKDNIETKKKDTKDLFSDNIFDDVDDIFSSDIKIPSTSVKQSLFDDDDLFSDVAKQSKKENLKPEVIKTNLFDSDDELFSDIKTTEITNESQIDKSDQRMQESSLKTVQNDSKDVTILKSPNNKEEKTPNKDQSETKSQKTAKTVSIFDSDSDDDIFDFDKPKVKSNINTNLPTSSLIKKEVKTFVSPSLFDDDEMDDLFTSKENNTKIQNSNEASCESPKNIQSKINSIVEITEPKTPTSQSLNINKETSNSTNKEQENKNVSDWSDNENEIIVPDAKSTIYSENKTSITLDKNTESENNEQNSDIYSKLERSGSNESQMNDILQGNTHTTVENVPYTSDEISPSHDLSFNNDNLKDTIPKENTKQEPIFNEPIDINEPPLFEPIDAENKFSHTISDRDYKRTESNDDTNQLSKEFPKKNDVIDNIPPVMPVLEPPAFEKTKEPKKSKNVNALFDDDSEDEALFFKKNDVISDVKPDLFTTSANFGLFADEPPALDDWENDIFEESNKNDPKLDNQETIATENIFKKEVNMFTDENTQKPDKIERKIEATKATSQSLFDNDSDEDIFNYNKPSTSKKEKVNIFINDENNKNSVEENSAITKTLKGSIFDDLEDNLFTNNIQTKDNNTEPKKVGKITSSININVQALIPGASHKKVNTQNTPIEVKLDTDSKMVKSISFEEDPDTEVLDSNISKSRARIQVKRRPSSRKARHEAVRKSTVNIEQQLDDEFEQNNSQKHDDNPKLIPKETTEYITSINKNDIFMNDPSLDIIQKNPNVESNISPNDCKSRNIDQYIDSVHSEKQSEKGTKIVYVLTDEDIFTKSNQNSESQSISVKQNVTEKVVSLKDQVDSAKVGQTAKDISKPIGDQTKLDQDTEIPAKGSSKKLSLFDSDDEIEKPAKENSEKVSKNMNNKSIYYSDEVIGNASTSTDKLIKDTIQKGPKSIENSTTNEEKPTKNTKKISLFDSDDEGTDLFKTKPIVTKTKLFDSDDETDDIFASKKKVVGNNEKMKKSLFDDDDEDLFGAKTYKETKPKPSSSKETSSKPVFADPLTLFPDDD